MLTKSELESLLLCELIAHAVKIGCPVSELRRLPGSAYHTSLIATIRKRYCVLSFAKRQ